MTLKRYLEGAIYIAGMIPLVVWKDPVRSALGDWLSLLVAVAYLLAIRALGLLAIRAVDWSHIKAIEKHNRSVEERKQASQKDKGTR